MSSESFQNGNAGLSLASSRGRPGRGLVIAWLATSTAMVFLMVVIGGITRLTESGLSMAEWRPLIGWLPPLGAEEWERVFALYRETPEFRSRNAWMTLEDFQGIFWWEYIHRLWGRLIGVVFIVPLLALWWTGRLEPRLIPGLAALLVLGAVQGGIGWWMVTSGLVDDPAVSQYRLAVHLLIAFLIYGGLLWMLLSAARGRAKGGERSRGLQALTAGLLVLVLVVVGSGALVAGLDAGLTYNTFPLMDGDFVPAGYAAFEPWWLNLFENIGSVQFNHRWLATGTAGLILLTALFGLGRAPTGRARLAFLCWGAMAVLQVGLGILTLIHVVPIPLAALHQAGALLVLSLGLWALRELRD